MFKVGPGDPFFYSDGEFALDIPRGRSQIVVERGTEFTPWKSTVEADKNGLATQGRIIKLLDGRKEGVEIGVEDGAWSGHEGMIPGGILESLSLS